MASGKAHCEKEFPFGMSSTEAIDGGEAELRDVVIVAHSPTDGRSVDAADRKER